MFRPMRFIEVGFWDVFVVTLKFKNNIFNYPQTLFPIILTKVTHSGDNVSSLMQSNAVNASVYYVDTYNHIHE